MWTIFEDGWHEISTKVKPKYTDHRLWWAAVYAINPFSLAISSRTLIKLNLNVYINKNFSERWFLSILVVITLIFVWGLIFLLKFGFIWSYLILLKWDDTSWLTTAVYSWFCGQVFGNLIHLLIFLAATSYFVSKSCQQSKMVALISWLFWLHFGTMGRNGNRLSMFINVISWFMELSR